VQCIPQQMNEMRPFTIPDHKKVLENRFFAWWEVGVCRARCCALSLAPGHSPRGNWQGGQHPSEPAQAPRQGHRTSPNPPIQIMIHVCNRAKGGSLFQSGCQGIQGVVVAHVTGAFWRSARHQQTCNHACKQSAHENNFHKASKQCILCVQ
jgi:hypothetical protein